MKADAKTKIITKYTVTAASVHDSNEFKNLVDKGNKKVWADSGYVGKEDEFPEDVRKDVKFIICCAEPHNPAISGATAISRRQEYGKSHVLNPP